MKASHHRRPRAPHGLQQTDRARRDGGYVLVKFALLLVPLLLMSGFAVDVGSWYSRAADIQKAADAAALAGVVWLPDEGEARTQALAAAARNGFSPGGTIDVKIERAGDRRLRVTITDSSVSSFFYRNLGGRTISMSRTGLAEYVLPVPLGSPRNYFGTGRLLSGSSTELLYQSVNPACTSKVNGDRLQSLHYNPLAYGGASLSSCSSTPSNSDFRTKGYELYVEAHPDRSANIDVLLYDPRYNDSDLGGCASSYTTQTGTTNMTITGPKLYSISTWNGSSWVWGDDTPLLTGQSFTYRRDRLRYKTCSSDPDFAIDSFRGNGAENFTFTLFAADNTPLNDSDNLPVTGCSTTYTASSPLDITYLGSRRWSKLCTITPTMPDGRYILRVNNDGTASELGDDGSNQWGVVAKFANAAGNGLCDGRTAPLCPRVFGRDAISVYANTPDGTASFFLAEIEPEHDGKTLELELWDPGEGGSSIEIQKPSGADAWTSVTFDWASYTEAGTQERSGSGNSVALRSGSTDLFNGRLLRIQIPLDNYSPPTNNRWWKIKYTFASGSVTDRTTWSAKVIGDPVHLLEEEAP